MHTHLPLQQCWQQSMAYPIAACASLAVCFRCLGAVVAEHNGFHCGVWCAACGGGVEERDWSCNAPLPVKRTPVGPVCVVHLSGRTDMSLISESGLWCRDRIRIRLNNIEVDLTPARSSRSLPPRSQIQAGVPLQLSFSAISLHHCCM